MNDLDRAFIQSFNDEYNKIISKVISTNENTNVDKLFKGINIPSECIICYESFPITDYTPYGCQHFACLVCVKECIRTNNNKCSICKLL